ncbi:MAG: DNA-methyltransferase [bacterium]
MDDVVYKFGDCRELIKNVEDKSVRLVITSPPYNLGKNYGKYNDDKPFEKWRELINDITKEIQRVLTDDGSFFLNLSPIPIGRDKEILPLPFLGYEILKSNGFSLRNMITWHFNGMQNCTLRLSGRYENILWAVKDLKNYVFNLDDVRIPYITKNDKRLTGKGRNPTDVWYFDRVNNMTKNKLNISHPTVYPIEMIERIIKMASDKGDVVLDPFLGSGTTLVASKKLGRRGIGFELDKKYEKDIKSRLKNEANYLLKENTDERNVIKQCSLFKKNVKKN